MSVIEEACNRVAILDKSRIAECGEVEEDFRRPKSEIAKQLILGEGAGRSEFTPGGRRVRIVFDGKSAFEPIIADIVLNCKAAVNIMFADTRTIDGVKNGQKVKLQTYTARPVIFEDLAVRVSPEFASFVHLDSGEANACGFQKGDLGRILP